MDSRMFSGLWTVIVWWMLFIFGIGGAVGWFFGSCGSGPLRFGGKPSVDTSFSGGCVDHVKLDGGVVIAACDVAAGVLCPHRRLGADL